MFTQILTIIGIALLVWMLYRGVKGNPEAFSRANLSKSFSTLGFLALALIALVTVAVLFLKK